MEHLTIYSTRLHTVDHYNLSYATESFCPIYMEHQTIDNTHFHTADHYNLLYATENRFCPKYAFFTNTL